MKVVNNCNAQSVEIEAVIIRADGRREALGTIAYYNKNIFKTMWWKTKNFLRKFLFKNK